MPSDETCAETSHSLNGRGSKLSGGEWVEVRSKAEILRTLDQDGTLDHLPFMPEMFAFCGRRFRVYKRAHKTCDTITGEYKGRRMRNTVHLENVRCDGASHDGCQAGCLIFWKEAWVKPVSGEAKEPTVTAPDLLTESPPLRTETDVAAATRVASSEGHGHRYICQSTRLLDASEPLSAWDPRQYLEDLASKNVSLRTIGNGFIYVVYHRLVDAGVGLGGLLRWMYDGSARLRGGYPYPHKNGRLQKGRPTPIDEVEFEVGEMVRVKQYSQILSTLDEGNKNRGLLFDAEMVPFCGNMYRVLKKVTKVINEKTGEMLHFKRPCYILEGVICEARYSECRLFCPRALYSFWRGIWLEKVTPQNANDSFAV